MAVVIPIMDSAYHFLVEGPGGTLISNTEVLPAPQANMMAAIINGLMSSEPQPYLLYSLGGLVAVLLWMASVPMLAFSLGMYLPISINMAVLAGGICAWAIGRSGGSEEIRTARAEQGTLIASGMMAGAAIAGIFSAVLRLTAVGAPIRWLSMGMEFELKTNEAGAETLKHHAAHWFKGFTGQMIGFLMFIGLGVACYFLARLGAKWELAEAASKAAEPEETPEA